MTLRWPVHPRPLPGEALTSWLSRTADRYGTTVDDLVFDLGYSLDRHDDLDLAPPMGFVDQLAVRTGVHADQIRSMSINGYTPWLLDQIEPGPEAFTTYTRQMAVLLPESNPRNRTVSSWRAWVPSRTAPQHRACPQCVLESTQPHPYQLTWSLPLMLICPFHRCLLEPYDGMPGYYFDWGTPSGVPESRSANSAIQAMDARTWQALTLGSVDLPRRRIHAGTWFRLLRALIDELGATLADCGAAQRLTRDVWQRAGHPIRAGQAVWRPYEELPHERQLFTLEAAATAMHALENAILTGQGRGASLFLAQPDQSVDPGRPQQETDPTVVAWRNLTENLDRVIEEARQNCDTARQLFHFVTYYRRDDEEFLHRVRSDFGELGISLEFLSH